ncbi:Mpo1 family 2-hydroxy fatty acid dioxygenase [Cupriavidus agavae]|uniref:Putative membrane protein YGL010W n=1 Tax=Cupriavidus agavae TaxID=1001822 RepID=A0A4Q7RDT0_9BURK|nr:Mpo1-like protein [Cupriavidus agavae]RZT31323.1 putative membrane protein YGL010W [Cupriavidus agavae]
MKTLIDHLSQYAAYHRDARNVVTHFVGIPMIVLAVTTLLGRPGMPLGDSGLLLTPAVVVYALACLFYLRLSLGFGLAMAAILAAFVCLGAWLAALSTTAWLASGIGLFVLGWVIQFVGHYFEGRKPAFVDDLVGLLVGPLFLVAETAFALGLARETRDAMAAHAH